MQLHIKNWSLSSLAHLVNPHLWNTKPPVSSVLKEYSIFRTCNRLPMDNFLQALCDSDLTALSIGEAPVIELQEAWVMILEEYYELKGTDPGAEWYLNRDILRLQNHLFILNICIDFLATRYSEKIAHSVCVLGYMFKPVIKDPNEYRNLLQVIVNKSKTKEVTLLQLQKQYDERVKERKEYRPPSREYFESLLVHIEEMQGTAYNFETLTVNKFVTLEKKYWKQVDFLKERTNK